MLLLSFAAGERGLAPFASAQSNELSRDQLPPPQPSFRRWTIEDGLPQSTVTSIAQTRDGALWAGTFGGLVRFDGVQFEVFSMATTPEFRGNRVFTLAAGSDGSLWIGMQRSGLLRTVNGEFERIELPWEPGSGIIRDLCFDDEQTLWIAGRTLAKQMNGRLTTIPDLPADPLCLQFDNRGDLWIAYSQAVIRWNPNSQTRFEFEQGLVSALALSPAGEILVGLNTGQILVHREGAWVDRLRLKPGRISSIGFDSDNRLRVISSEGFHISSDSEVLASPSIAPPELVLEEALRVTFIDRENNTWLGSEAGGLLRLRAPPIPHLPIGSSLYPTFSGNGRLWFVCDYRVGSLVSDQFRPLSVMAQEKSFPTGLVSDGLNGLWIGTEENGLYHYTGHSLEQFPSMVGIDKVTSLLRTVAGELWVGTGTRVGVFADGEFEPVADLGDPVRVLLESKAGTIFVGTSRAVLELADRAVTTLVQGPEDREFSIRALYEDKTGALWVGTYGLGLIREKDSAVVSITTASGLADDSILALVPDDLGYLWMNSNRGAFRVRVDELNGYCEGELDSVQSDTFSGVEGNGPSAAARDEFGRIWMATISGLSVVDPERIPINTVPPGVAIDHLLVDGVEISARSPIVAPGRGDLDIRYSGLSYTDPRAVRFRFLLEGYQEQWYSAGTSRTASFASVPPGAYTFRVQACNNSGVWSTEGAAFPFTIRAAFYQTTWFLGLCAAFVVLLFFFAHRVRVRRVDAQNMILESKIRGRTTELAGLNEELGAFTTTVSHDLRSPLRHIGFFAQRIRSKLTGNEDAQTSEDLTGIVESSNRMGQLISDLLILSKLGRKQVVRTPVETEVLVRSIWEELTGDVENSQTEFSLDSLPTMYADKNLLPHLWSNLLDNAFKYSSRVDRPRIQVSSYREGERVWFRVADNGVGFDPRFADQIFAPFERLHSESEFTGTGVGLAIVQRMIQKHGGEITAKSELGKGAVFEFTLDPPT